MTKHRRRVKQTRSLEDRMAEQATKLKEQADQLPAGEEREALLKRARIAETGAHLSDWLKSPGYGHLNDTSELPWQADLTFVRDFSDRNH